jgi:hypothetical protein
MKCLLGLIAMLPFLVNANTTSPSNHAIVQSILNLSKVGVNTSPILDELPNSTKAELLNIIPQEIQNSDSSEIIDLRSLENDLKKSIHDTI